MIDQMEALLVGFGVPNAVSEIAGVRQQLQLTGSGAGAVTAVARTPDHLDLFWVGLDGSVGSNWWDAHANNGAWNAAFEIAPAGSAAGAVTAVARTPDHLDVFWVGLDGSVGSNWWDAHANNGAWNTPFEIAPAKSAQGAVTAVARTPDHLDLFWVGLDGSVGSNWWDAHANNGAWNTPFEIAPAKSAQGAVTAVARTPDHLDLFWVGLDGSVGSNWWDAHANNGAWNTPFEIAPAKSAQGAVTAVARTPDHLDLFWVGLDGSVGSNWWDAHANNGAWNTPFEIAPAKSAQGAVTAVARTPDHLDLFWVGLDGSVGSNWWDAHANNGAWNTPFEIAPAGSAAGAVTAVARTPDHLDVFWVGRDGSVGTNWWDAHANNGAWNTPFERFGP